MHLPDVHGLNVIERLSTLPDRVPALGVTGFYLGEDIDRHARSAGAVAFKFKPLWAEEIGPLLRQVASAGPSSVALQNSRPLTSDRTSTVCMAEAVSTAFRLQMDPVLGDVSGKLQHLAVVQDQASDQSTTDAVIRTILGGLANPALSLAGFGACAAGLRLTLVRCQGDAVERLPEDVLGVLHKIRDRSIAPHDPTVQQALDEFVRSARWWPEDRLAATVGTSRQHLWELLSRDLQMDYRTLRWLVVMKAAAIEVLTTTEYIPQIAYGLGLHPGSLDRDFHKSFGCSPGQMRRLWRRAAPSRDPVR